MKRALILLVFLLQACGDGGYWELKHTPVEIAHIARVDYPCAMQNARGCWNPVSRTIEIKHGLSASDEACVMRHERAHAAGWVHPENMAFVWDCGPPNVTI